MTTIPVPEQRALVIGLSEYLQDVLGDSDYQPIGKDRAEAIYQLTKNHHSCYIQFPSEETPELKVPLLWKFPAWAASVERNRVMREKDEKERVEKWIMKENRSRIKFKILKLFSISETQAELLAHRMLSQKRWEDIKQIGVTLAETEKDL